MKNDQDPHLHPMSSTVRDLARQIADVIGGQRADDVLDALALIVAGTLDQQADHDTRAAAFGHFFARFKAISSRAGGEAG